MQHYTTLQWFVSRMKYTICLMLVLVCVGCGVNSYYMVGEQHQRQRIRELLHHLEKPYISEQMRLTLFELISTELLAAGYPGRMRNFLIQHIEQHPTDTYNAHYLYMIATSYLQNDHQELARYYLHRVVWNHSDVEIEGESVHEKSLIALISIEDNEQRRASFLEELLERFPDITYDPVRYLQLAHSYENIAEWDQAFVSYQKLVDLCAIDNDNCRDLPNGANIATINANLRFWQATRTWSTEELDDLVSFIKQALSQKDVRTLLEYRPSVNFFARSWQQEEFDFNSQINFNIGIFLRRSQVSYSNSIDINSNTREAYLRTWGWSYRIPTWYFYFRKIDFPADPSVHGNWEWAGIFFGEQL